MKSTSIWMNIFDEQRARRNIAQKHEEISKENSDGVLQFSFQKYERKMGKSTNPTA